MTSDRGVFPPHSAGFQIVGLRSGPYLGVKMNPLRVSARKAVKSLFSEPSKPTQIDSPSGGFSIQCKTVLPQVRRQPRAR